MAMILGKAWTGYKLVFEDLVDHRAENWFLVAKPYQGIALLGLYLMFVLKWGPEWMKDRPAFNLKKTMIVYNAVQVIVCFYLFIESLRVGWGPGKSYKWICEPVDYSNSEQAIRVAELVHIYFMLKVADLLDTVFFVLRKKFNQVTFLHVYHHTGMVMLVWGASTYFPGGHGSLVGVINSFVHTVMYSYYLIAVFKPSVKDSSWKKYITQLQIIQFFWTVVHMGALVFKPDCQYPRWSAAVFLPQNLFMLILFIDFYIRVYIKKPQGQKKESQQNGQTKESLQNGEKKENLENGQKMESPRNGDVTLNDEKLEQNGFTKKTILEISDSHMNGISLDHRLQNGSKQNGKMKHH